MTDIGVIEGSCFDDDILGVLRNLVFLIRKDSVQKEIIIRRFL